MPSFLARPLNPGCVAHRQMRDPLSYSHPINTLPSERKTTSSRFRGTCPFRGVFLGFCGVVALHLLPGETASGQGICDRTPQVRDKLMEVSGVSNCREVTAEHLSDIRGGLDLDDAGISSLQAHDFRGLSSLYWLRLRQNSLSELPEGIFQGLNSLQVMWLQENSLIMIPEGIFSGLGRLRILYLDSNSLSELPAGIFNGLSSLKDLNLSGNSLRELPEQIFSGLSQLRRLRLHGNQLTTLAKGAFSRLNNLVELWLSHNPMDELPLGIFDDVLGSLNSDPNYSPGLHLDSHLKATLAFASTGQIGFQGTTMRARVVLSRALPVAVRVPFSVGGTATSDDYTGLSPNPDSGLLFLAGEMSKEIVISLLRTDNTLRKTIILTLGGLSQIGLRRSDGTGPDAPFLKSERLLDRPEDQAVHTITMASPSTSADVCNRTPQVRDKLTEAAGVSSCEQVTLGHLAGLVKLDLSRTGITELEPEDFNELSSLETLWLHGNSLRELPEGVFDDVLDTLEDLRVDPHLKATLFFQLSEQKTVEGATMRIRVWLSPALPVAVRVPYAVGGTATKDDYRILSPNPEEGLVFLAGERAKTIRFTISEDADSLGKTIVLTLGNLSRIGLRRSDGGIEDSPRLGAEVLLDRSAERGTHTVTVAHANEPAAVCDRTPQVRDRLILGAESCSDVTAADLASIRVVNLFDTEISSLQAHEFNGLTGLTRLSLSHNNLSELPEGIFNGLINLEVLYLGDNDLNSLPEGVFGGLDSLKLLDLSSNNLSTLPDSIFHELGSLMRLYLQINALSTLPDETFSGLHALERLWLQNNALSTLPKGLFHGLNALEALLLYRNSLKELPPGIFSGLGNLRQLQLHRNSLTALPEEIFQDLVSLNELLLISNPVNELPERVFSGLTNLNFLWLPGSSDELPKGIFDDVLDTLGDTFQWPAHLSFETFKRLPATQRGELLVAPYHKATLAFASSGQGAAEGTTVTVPVTLSRVLPVAVRVPYTIGFSDPSLGLRGSSPDPHSGLLFPAGETRREISFNVLKNAQVQAERLLVVTLGKPAEIGLRPSDGRGPDAPYLKTESLLLRSREGSIHTVTVFDSEPLDREPYCLSLWEGAPCSTAASLPQVFTGPMGESRATTEVAITNKDPAVADCEVAVLFHRGTSPAPPVAFNGRFPDRNLFRASVPRGGATVLTLASPDARELTTGAVYVFTRSPCTPDSLDVRGIVLLENQTDGDIEELFSLTARSPSDWLEHGDCRVLTSMFGAGRNLGIASVTAEPGMAAPAGTRLLFKAFDLKGDFIGRLSGLEVSGAYYALTPWEFDEPTTLQICLDVPGNIDFQLAVTAIGTKAAGAKVQYSTERFITDPQPEDSESGP